MPSHMEARSPGSKGKKYPDDGNGSISRLQNSTIVKIHDVKKLRFRIVGIVRVVLDLVKDETEVIDAQFRARSQKNVDCVDRGVIIGA